MTKRCGMFDEKRDTSAHKVKGWEYLRELGSAIKANVLSNLDELFNSI